MILIIDNYDSFTYNLYQYIGEIEPDIRVVRNDETGVGDIIGMHPTHVIISPGPGHPVDAGISVEAVKGLAGVVPVLGVCLGHQAVGLAFGAEITYAANLMHGKSSQIKLDCGCRIFRGLPQYITAGRYHSLAVKSEGMPSDLEVAAISDDDEIMAVRHRRYDVYGLQFHPESVLTPYGKAILKNFLDIGQDRPIRID